MNHTHAINPDDARFGADLQQALELLAVLRAWYHTHGDIEDPHRDHELFPLIAGGGIEADKTPLWRAVDALLGRHGVPVPGQHTG